MILVKRPSEYRLFLQRFLLFLFLPSCASIKAPDGGDPDRSPPRLLRAKARFTRSSWKITLRWNEYLSPTSQLTPPGLWTNPSLPFSAKVVGKKIRIRIDSVEKGTSLFIWGGPGIKDFTEGNPLPPTLLWHTGDSLRGRDTIRFAFPSTKPNIPLWVEFRSDSLYFRFLGWEGKLWTHGLPEGLYHAWAWQDEDQNNRWDISEPVILSELPYRHPYDTLREEGWGVWRGDTFPPKVPLPALQGSGRGLLFFTEPIFLRAFQGRVDKLGETVLRMTEGSTVEIADSAGNTIQYTLRVTEVDTRAYRPRLLWVEEVNARTPYLYLRATERLRESRDTFWVAKVQDSLEAGFLCIQGDEAWLAPLTAPGKVEVHLHTAKGETLSTSIPTRKFLLHLPQDSGVVAWRVYTASGYPLMVQPGDSLWLPRGSYPAMGLSAWEEFWQPIAIRGGVPYRRGAQILSRRIFTVGPERPEADANKP